MIIFSDNILSLMPFLGFCSLLIGKIFKSLGFNGSIFLFVSWIILSLMFILIFKKKEIDFVVINHRQIENPEDYITVFPGIKSPKFSALPSLAKMVLLKFSNFHLKKINLLSIFFKIYNENGKVGRYLGKNFESNCPP